MKKNKKQGTNCNDYKDQTRFNQNTQFSNTHMQQNNKVERKP